MNVAPVPNPAQAWIADYNTAYQTSPIILVGGLAASSQGGVAPLSSFLPPPGSDGQAFATFLPAPGSTLISQQVATYPFFNQFIAANTTIQQPLTISLIMIAPVNQPGGYLSKLHAMTALQQTLQQHNALGGMYAIATPAFIYNNCLITSMTDVTAEESEQKQIQYQLDFIQPIVTQQEATTAENSLMQTITSGTQIAGPPTWSGTPAASPANLTSVTAALAAFGGVISP